VKLWCAVQLCACTVCGSCFAHRAVPVLCYAVQAASAALTEQWYPPVRGTLLLLSKLYRCVDMRIFAGLAQEAVAACTVTVQVGCSSKMCHGMTPVGRSSMHRDRPGRL
jgi:hypothetical protein